MSESFDEWWDTLAFDNVHSQADLQVLKDNCRKAFNAGERSRQQEIDRLTRERDALREAVKDLIGTRIASGQSTIADHRPDLIRLIAEPCDHDWVDARNEVVASGEVCLKCHAVRASAGEGEG